MSQSNGQCHVVGCKMHFTSKTSNRKSGKLILFRVHFRSADEIYKHAVESVSRVVAAKERSGKGLPDRASHEAVDIYCDAEFSKTKDDLVAEYATMTKAQKQELARLAREQLAALEESDDDEQDESEYESDEESSESDSDTNKS